MEYDGIVYPPMTNDEIREALEEDGRMTPEEIDEWIESLEM
tara:strand:+ start:31 stop:153 length:123 start_codon:yes stop_codon:yes gene_type:complete